MLGKNKKPKKKNLNHHPLPYPSPHYPDLLASARLVWTSLSSEPREGEGTRGGVALGTYSRSPPPLPVPGWVGCQVYLCTSCTLINLCKSPHPGPSMFLCLCSFPSSSQGFSSFLPTSPPGSGWTWATSFGVPFMESSAPPSQPHRVHYPSG